MQQTGDAGAGCASGNLLANLFGHFSLPSKRTGDGIEKLGGLLLSFIFDWSRLRRALILTDKRQPGIFVDPAATSDISDNLRRGCNREPRIEGVRLPKGVD